MGEMTGALVDWRYRLGDLISSDGAGEVYEAEQLRLNRTVSIKMLSAFADQSPAQVDRFLREANVLARLNHPGIVYLVDFGIHLGRPYLVRDIVRAPSLAEKPRPFLAEDALPLLLQIAEALEHAHLAGIVHRDLRPTNILFVEAKRVRIGDFGLARILDNATEVSNLTAPGVVVGTSWYMSPEQAQGRLLDARSDLYSLGAIAFELLAGRRVFEAASLSEAIRLQSAQPAPLLSQATSLPKEAHSLCAIVDRLLASDPEGRYPTASWVINALRAASTDLALPDASADAEMLRSNALVPSHAPPSAPSKAPPRQPSNAPPRLRSNAPPRSSSAPSAGKGSLPPFVPAAPAAGPPALPRTSSQKGRAGEPSSMFSLSEDLPSFFQPSLDIPPPPELSKLQKEERARRRARERRAAVWGGLAVAYVIGVLVAVWVVCVGPPNAARDVRQLVREGKFVNVIPQVERFVKEDPTNAALEASLGFARLHTKNPEKAGPDLAAAVAKDPSSLEPADIAALVALLAMADPATQPADRALVKLGAFALPWLHEAWARQNGDRLRRCRVAAILTELGESRDPEPPCSEVLRGAGAGCAARELAIDRLAAIGGEAGRRALLAAAEPKGEAFWCQETAAAIALQRIGSSGSR